MEVVRITSPDPESLTWFVFEPPNANETPEWLRSAAIDDTGTAWACASFIHQLEILAVLEAGLDREPAVMSDGHFYLRIPWMRAHCPEYAAVLAHFERGLTLAAQQSTAAGAPLH